MTGIQTLCINLPCHSSPSAWLKASAFAKDYDLNLIKVDLTSAFNAIHGQSMTQNAGGIFPDRLEDKKVMGALKSSLRAPPLHFHSVQSKGLVVGTGNRSEDNLLRYYQKVGDGSVDISPIADLFKSEVYELFVFLAKKMRPLVEEKSIGKISTHKNYQGDISGLPQSAIDILVAAPTADLWGPNSDQTDESELGMTYDEIEWADRQNIDTQYVLEGITRHDQDVPGIVCLNSDPTKHPRFQSYTSRQKEVICKMHALEKISRHKHNPALPVCTLRDKDFIK